MQRLLFGLGQLLHLLFPQHLAVDAIQLLVLLRLLLLELLARPLLAGVFLVVGVVHNNVGQLLLQHVAVGLDLVLHLATDEIGK